MKLAYCALAADYEAQDVAIISATEVPEITEARQHAAALPLSRRSGYAGTGDVNLAASYSCKKID